jgi:hypothetical protein
MNSTNFVHDDGGRAAAGFKGQAGDCTVRAIAIVTKIPYRTVYNDLNRLVRKHNERKRKYRSKTAGRGVHRCVYDEYLKGLGWRWKSMTGIGIGCRVHLSANELPSGRIICRLSGHHTAVIDGVIHDTYDPSRNGTRCVYGYWEAPDGSTPSVRFEQVICSKRTDLIDLKNTTRDIKN